MKEAWDYHRRNPHTKHSWAIHVECLQGITIAKRVGEKNKGRPCLELFLECREAASIAISNGKSIWQPLAQAKCVCELARARESIVEFIIDQYMGAKEGDERHTTPHLSRSRSILPLLLYFMPYPRESYGLMHYQSKKIKRERERRSTGYLQKRRKSL